MHSACELTFQHYPYRPFVRDLCWALCITTLHLGQEIILDVRALRKSYMAGLAGQNGRAVEASPTQMDKFGLATIAISIDQHERTRPIDFNVQIGSLR
jgi:hypothetical protein